jgi:hypothetical protein
VPRKRATQPAVAAPGQQYGQNQAQVASQAQIPLPQVAGPADMVASRDQARTQGAPSPEGQPGPAAAAPDLAMLMQMAGAAQGPGGGIMNAPITSPEPITNGAPFGPGFGPGILGVPDVSPILIALAEETGDATLLTMAQRARIVSKR